MILYISIIGMTIDRSHTELGELKNCSHFRTLHYKILLSFTAFGVAVPVIMIVVMVGIGAIILVKVKRYGTLRT